MFDAHASVPIYWIGIGFSNLAVITLGAFKDFEMATYFAESAIRMQQKVSSRYDEAATVSLLIELLIFFLRKVISQCMEI